VTVSWAASTLSTGGAVDGYVVTRYDAATLTAQVIQSACTGTIATTICTESVMPAGQWRYTVTPVFATNWRGAESLKSTAVTTTESTPPVNAISVSGAGGTASMTGSTVYYRGVAAGSFTLTNAVSDSGSGPASSATASLTGTPTGWTHTPSTVSTPSGGPFVSSSFAWTAGTTSTPGEIVTGRDVAGNTAATSLSLVNDSTAPTGGSVGYFDGTSYRLTISVTFANGTDAGSGIGIRLLQRASATLTGTTCGTFGAYSTVTNGTNPTSPLVNSVSRGSCYLYRYLVSDVLGNQSIYGSANVDKVATYLTTITSTAGLVNEWRLGESTTSSDSFTGTAGALLDSRTGEIGATWTLAPTSADSCVISAAGRLRKAGNKGEDIYYPSGVPASADYTVEADVYVASNLSGDVVGVAGRVDPTGGGSQYTAGYTQSTQRWNLNSVVNGTPVLLGQSTVQALTVGATYRLALDLNGPTIRLLVDGAQLVSVVSTAITTTGKGGVDLGFGAGKVIVTDATGMQLDNFRITPPLTDSKGTSTGDYLSGPSLAAVGAISGDPSTAAQFDGINDFGRVPGQITNNFSIEFWFTSTQGIGTSAAWDQGAGLVTASITGAANDVGVSLRSDGRIVAGMGTPTISVASTAGGYNNGTWHHVVFTRDMASGALGLYVDGALVGSATGTTTSFTNAIALSFGRIPVGTNFFAGTLDEVALYNTALAAATVTSHHDSAQ
jgi:hypothetical protein